MEFSAAPKSSCKGLGNNNTSSLFSRINLAALIASNLAGFILPAPSASITLAFRAGQVGRLRAANSRRKNDRRQEYEELLQRCCSGLPERTSKIHQIESAV